MVLFILIIMCCYLPKGAEQLSIFVLYLTVAFPFWHHRGATHELPQFFITFIVQVTANYQVA